MSSSNVQTSARLRNAHFHPTGHADALAAPAAGSQFCHLGNKLAQNNSSGSAAQQLMSYYVMLFSHHNDFYETGVCVLPCELSA